MTKRWEFQTWSHAQIRSGNVIWFAQQILYLMALSDGVWLTALPYAW